MFPVVLGHFNNLYKKEKKKNKSKVSEPVKVIINSFLGFGQTS